MFAKLTSYPPLGHETLVPHDQNNVTFKVSLEADEHRDWEVQLWHSLNDVKDHWKALPFETIKEDVYNVATPNTKTSSKRWFKVTLRAQERPQRPVHFTLRFRVRGEQGWKWVNDQSSAPDGTLLYQSHMKAAPQKLTDCFDNLSSDLKVDSGQSDTPDTILWTIKAAAAPAKGEMSGYSNHVLGYPKHLVRWFSLVRLWSPWLAPRQGKGPPFAEKDGVLYSFLRSDGFHVVVLAISGMEDVLTVFRHEHDQIVINARNDRDQEGTAHVVVAVGKTFEEANAAVMYRARRMVAPYFPVSAEDQKVMTKIEEKSKDVRASWIQDWYDGFTYCTWNGLGQNLTEEKISGALASLEKAGINITNLIIDDNWQSLDNEGESQMIRGWTDFEGNPKGFPDGMKAAISKIRSKYPALQHIGVWHALLGYWGGVSPNGKIAQNYKTELVKKRSDVAGGTMTVVSASDAKRMYDDFYTFLLSTGIDAVKTDAQFFIDEIDTAPARRSLTSTYLSTWQSAHLRHFSATAISCMSQTPTILFPYQLPQIGPAIPVRNSDDFFPEIEESHPWHIFCNAHNALLAQHCNVLPDWDMFQTSHHWAGFHASARAISGGPIYITDEPGKHDTGLISQMTAQTTRGQTVILRPSVVGRSAETYVGFEDERLVKVRAFDGASKTGSAFLGFWNCRGNAISEIVPLSDFMSVETGVRYLLRSHRTGACGVIPSSEEETAVFGVTVGSHEWELFSLRPVSGPFELEKEKGKRSFTVANLGLVGKMTGAAAIVRTEVSVHTPGSEEEGSRPSSLFSSKPAPKPRLRFFTTLKTLGVLGVWVGELEGVDLREDTFVLLEGKPVPFGCLRKGKEDKRVLEVDVERAWKEMGLQGGYSNQLDVEVFLS